MGVSVNIVCILDNLKNAGPLVKDVRVTRLGVTFEVENAASVQECFTSLYRIRRFCL